MKRTIGKAKIEIISRGCVDCGTEHARGWPLFKRVPVQIGDSRDIVPVNICDECVEKRRLKSDEATKPRSDEGSG